MKYTEENKKACEEILNQIKLDNGNYQVTWDGEFLHINPCGSKLHTIEVVLCRSLDCFGDPEHWEHPSNVFEFLKENCNPRGGIIEASFVIEGGRTHDEVCLVMKDAELAPRGGGEGIEFDNSHLLVEALFNHYDWVGELGCNDDEAWIWLDPSQVDDYPRHARFYYTQSETDNGFEWKADLV